MKKAFLPILDLYEPFEFADELVAIELRFIHPTRNKKTSYWLLVDGLKERYGEFVKVVHRYNEFFGMDAYVSVNVHSWERVMAKAKQRKRLFVAGDSTTTYPYIGGFSWDIDVVEIHTGQSKDYWNATLSFVKTKLIPFLKILGVKPRYIFYTGGGIQIRWKADDLYPINLLDEMERLNQVLNFFLQPEGKSDNIFDPPRVIRAPLSLNWKYGEPIRGEILYKSKEIVDLEFLLGVLRDIANEHGILSTRPRSKRPKPTFESIPTLRSIDVEFVFKTFQPFYLSNHQNDLLIRLFSLLALYKVDIFQALELLSKFVHDPKNTLGHVRNRLDHLTYPYGRVFNTVHKTPIKEIYGPNLYERLAEFYNTLVADLGISYKPDDFRRGLEETKGKVSSWGALRRVLLDIVKNSYSNYEEVVSVVLRSLRLELEGG